MTQKEIFIISIIIFLTVIAWLLTDIYHASVNEKLKVNIEKVEPINYDINADFFRVLKEKTP